MKLRHSTAFAGITALNILLLAIAVLHTLLVPKDTDREYTTNKALVRVLQLTDLCLFTEARYTRHPAMADIHAAFQEHPAALDHFPSGSMLLPLKR